MARQWARLLCGTGSLSLVVLGSVQSAHSQELDEIVVTARKSEENLQETPLAITALTSDTLKDANVRSIAGVVALTPGLSVQGDAQERGLAPVIRGLSFSGQNGDEGNVAVMIDGVYIANPGAISMGIMDFQRVEIVKGPQSALYGHNAFAGAINYVSKAPPKTLQADIEVRAGNYDTKSTQLSLGGPLIEGVLESLVSVAYDDTGGTYKDPVNGKELGGYEKKNANLLMRLTPNDWSTYDLGVYYGDDEFGPPNRVNFDYNCLPDDGEFTYYCGELPKAKSLLPLVASTFEPEDAVGNGRKVKHARVKGSFDLEHANVEVIAGYFDVESRNFSELSGVRDGLEFALVGSPAGTVFLPGFFGNQYNNEDYSGEIRVSSHQSQRVRWATGAYYYHDEKENQTNIAFNSDPIPAGRQIVCPGRYACNWLTPGAASTGFGGLSFGTTTQSSAFASVAFDTTEQLTLSAEARYTREEKDSDVISNPITPGFDPDGPAGQSADWSFWNPRFTANYTLTQDHFLYASAAKGSKAGGFNPNATLADELAYGPENNWTYEVGIKNTFLEGRMRLNVAVFYVDWQDLQVSVQSKDPTNVSGVTQNYGSVTAQGGEIELAALLYEGVTLNAGVAYTNPTFNDDAYDFGSVDLCLQLPDSCGRNVVEDAPGPLGPVPAVSLDGLLRPQSSEWQYTLALNATRPLVSSWDWFGNVNYKYESRQYTEVLNETWSGPRQSLGLQVGIESEKWRLALWAQNLTDDLTGYSSGGGQGITRWNDFSSVPRMDIPDRRRVGATVNYTF